MDVSTTWHRRLTLVLLLANSLFWLPWPGARQRPADGRR